MLHEDLENKTRSKVHADMACDIIRFRTEAAKISQGQDLLLRGTSAIHPASIIREETRWLRSFSFSGEVTAVSSTIRERRVSS